MTEQIRILLADGDTVFRDSLRVLLEAEPDFTVCGEAGDGGTALKLVSDTKPDLLLLSLSLQLADGIEVLRALSLKSSGIRKVIISAGIDWSEATEALRLGAHGIVLKDASPDLLFKSIRTVMAGEYWISHACVPHLLHAINAKSAKRKSSLLSARELQVVAAVLEGRTNNDIAEELCIAERTVKNHLWGIFTKLGVKNRLELAHSMIKPSKEKRRIWR
jgi:two-component system, NarL family, nitrate/nitrite response regulator NarL